MSAILNDYASRLKPIGIGYKCRLLHQGSDSVTLQSFRIFFFKTAAAFQISRKFTMFLLYNPFLFNAGDVRYFISSVHTAY